MKHLERVVGVVGLDDLPSASEARATWLAYRQANGRKSATAYLTAPSSQPKTGKNALPTWLLHLAPAEVSGFNACPWATDGCRAACLNTAGRGRTRSVQAGRIIRTTFLAEHPAAALALIKAEIERAVAKHGRIGVRLNGTSDLRWERIAPWLFDLEGVTFYDYTKAARRTVPGNYHLVGSVSERDTDERAVAKAKHFGSAAVVFSTRKGEALPSVWNGCQVIDGDEDDERWSESGGVIVGLRAKGDAIGDTSGFVRQV